MEEVLEEGNPGFFTKLLHLWVLPFIYAIVLGSIILNFTGVSFLSQFKVIQNLTKDLYSTINKPEKKEASKTSTSTDKKETAATSKNSDKTKTEQTTTDSQTKQNGPSKNKEASSAAESLSNMDPGTAAKLISYMKEANALKIFKLLDPEVQSAIIAELPSDEGARITEALASGYEPATSTTTAIQLYQQMQPEQIASVLNGIKNNEEVLYQIKQMDPNTASKVISQLKPEVAGWIVTQLKP
jgi:flagellar motility protein MotE (MotC chaperone)